MTATAVLHCVRTLPRAACAVAASSPAACGCCAAARALQSSDVVSTYRTLALANAPQFDDVTSHFRAGKRCHTRRNPGVQQESRVRTQEETQWQGNVTRRTGPDHDLIGVSMLVLLHARACVERERDLSGTISITGWSRARPGDRRCLVRNSNLNPGSGS